MEIILNRKNELKFLLINFITIIIGAAIMAASTGVFLLPNQLSSGGFSGIATIGYYLLKIPLGTTILILNIPLFIIAFIKNGKKFFINTIIGTVALSFFLNIFEKFPPVTTDRLLACIYGGIMTGIGTALILKANASTGGSDLFGNIIKAYRPNIKAGNVILAIDGAVIIANVLFFQNIEIGLYSAITIYIMGKMIDIFFEGINFTKILYIISPKTDEIAKDIGAKVKRGTTALYAKGMYKKEEKEVLLCVAGRKETIEIRKIVKRMDPKAFMIISNAREVFGEGFKM